METSIVENNGTGIVSAPPIASERHVSADDMLIPKVLLCQPTSVIGDVPQGHFAKSVEELDLGKSVTVIPLMMFKTWVNFDVSGGKPLYKFTEPCTYENDNLSWNYVEGGVQMRRDLNYNFYCLIPDEIDREVAAINSDDPDPDDALLPVVVSFSRTSSRIGKEIATHFAKIEKFRARNNTVSLYPSAFKLVSELNTNDKGKWYTWKIEEKTKSIAAHRNVCEQWHQTIDRKPVAVHDAEVTKQPVVAGAAIDAIGLDDVPF